MGIFDKKSDNLAYLEEERQKIWKRLTTLEENIEKRTPDYEREAKGASKKASEYRNRSQETKDEIDLIYSEIIQKLEEIKTIESSTISMKSEIEEIKVTALTENEEISKIKNELEERSNRLESKIEKISKILSEHPQIDSEVEQLEELLNVADDNSSKIAVALKTALSRKKEIDEIYQEIVGFETTDDNGEKTEVEGLKNELENQYNELIESADDLDKRIEEIKSNSELKIKEFLEIKNTESTTAKEKWDNTYKEIESRIKSLLPKALTSGLSYAFSEKKEAEEKSFKSLKTQFYLGISGLVLVSIIPFVISLVFLLDGEGWDTVIERAPRIVIAIIPLYFPVLWLAYSANKSINLSKRLIEEYAHKEVLSKTFEGLSTQIEQLENDQICSELRVRLLHDFLEVYSENPGKLISNYEASDHPVMDVLEKSYKLQGAVNKLYKIPGLERVAQIIEKKAIKEKEGKRKGIEEGLELTDSQNESE